MSSPPVGINKSWFRYFQFEEIKDSPSEVRNVLLVVVTVIAIVTFKAGVTPSGGVWQDDENATGRAIYATQKGESYVFLISNTIAQYLFITSLTHRFPFHFEIWVAAAFMLVTTYASAIFLLLALRNL